MLSLSQFRTHLLPLFRVMKATGQTFEVSYKGVVYDVIVHRTDKVSDLKRPKRIKRHELVSVSVAECPECGNLMMAGVCMNTNCSASTIPSNQSSEDE